MKREAPSVDLRSEPRRWWGLAVLCLALWTIVIDNTILNVALPTLHRALHATETDLQWITTAYALALSGLMLPFGSLGDRFGRRGLLLAGLVLFGSASAAAAFTSSPLQLTVSRSVMGVGGAATMPATLSILGNIFGPEERGRAIAIWSSTAGVAAAIGPIVGGLLLRRFWWGSVFLVNVPLVAVVLVAVVVLLPISRATVARPIDFGGTVLWAGSLAILIFAIIEGPVRGWLSPEVLLAFALSAALMASFAWQEGRISTPMLPPAVARNPAMRAGAVTIIAAFFAMFGAAFTLTQWIQGPKGQGPLVAGLCFGPMALITILTSTRNPALVRRWGQKTVVLAGMATNFVGFLLVAAAVTANQLALVVVAMMVVGAGEGLVVPSGVELIMMSVPPDQAGMAGGFNETLVEAGGAIGVAVLGSALTAGAGFDIPLLMAAAAILAGGFAIQVIFSESGLETA